MAFPFVGDSSLTRDKYDRLPGANYEALDRGPLVRTRHGLAPNGAAADWHIRCETEHLKLGELASDLDRNDPDVSQGTTRLVDNVLQNGFNVEPTTGSDEVNRILLEGYEAWSNDPGSCHAQGVLTRRDIIRTAFRSMIVAGDCFLVMRDNGTVDVLEWYRCRTPSNTKQNVVFGVEKDLYGRHVRAWFTKDPINQNQPLKRVNDTYQVDIRDKDGFLQVMHIADRQRASQTRGISKYAPLFKLQTVANDLQWSELVRANMQSCVTFVQSIMASASQPPKTASTIGDPVVVRTESGLDEIQYNLKPGLVVTPKDGHELEMVSPNINAGNYNAFMKALQSMSSRVMDLPPAVYLLDASEGNFANIRGIIQQCRMAWRRYQLLVRDQAEKPLYLWWVRNAFEEKSRRGRKLRELVAADNSIDVFSHRWHAPEWEYIEPMKDVTTDAMLEATGYKTKFQVVEQYVSNPEIHWQEVYRQRAWAIELCIEHANRLNEANPDLPRKVDWLQILQPSLPPGMSMSMQEPASEKQTEEKGVANA